MKAIIILLLSIMPAMVWAQESDTVYVGKTGIYVKDTDGSVVKIEPGSIKVYDQHDTVDISLKLNINDRKLKNKMTRWFLFELGTDILITEDDYRLESGIDPFEVNAWKSTNVNLHVFQQKFNLVKNRFNLQWGLGFEFHKHSFSNPVVLEADRPQATFSYQPEVNFKKNRLSYSYLTVPLMLNYESNPAHPLESFRVSVGGFAGPRLGGNFKTKVDGDKEKVRDDFNLTKWRYGLRAQLGYSWFNAYATLGLNDLFQESKNNGYVVTPLSIGIQIIPF